MDITTLLGIIIGIFLIISGIKMENIGNFWDIPSIQIEWEERWRLWLQAIRCQS